MSGLKSFLKVLLIFVGVIAALLFALALSFLYVTRWRLYDVGTQVSPDGRYSVAFQEVGEPDWPFGYAHARATLYDGKEKLTSLRVDVADDGGRFNAGNYAVAWETDRVTITFSGSEQDDYQYVLSLEDGETIETATIAREVPVSAEPRAEAPAETEDFYEKQAEEWLSLWATYEPDSCYVFPDGTEYRLVAVDHATGSSYFVLIASSDGFATAELINSDPFGSEGGVSTTLDFPNGGDIGTATLRTAGGETLSYCTTDRGRSFSLVNKKL